MLDGAYSLVLIRLLVFLQSTSSLGLWIRGLNFKNPSLFHSFGHLIVSPALDDIYEGYFGFFFIVEHRTNTYVRRLRVTFFRLPIYISFRGMFSLPLAYIYKEGFNIWTGMHACMHLYINIC